MEARTEGSRLWLTASLATVLVASLGAALGWWLRGGAARPEFPARALEREAADAVTREQLEAVEARILAELQRLARPRADGASAPATADAAVNELGRRIDALDARIALLSTGARPGNAGHDWGSLRGPGGESLAKIFERIQEWHRRMLKHEEQEDICEVLRKEHNLWTIEDVFRAYGAPDHVSSSSGLALYYGRFALEKEESPCYVYFRILEGFVIEVGFDCVSGW